MINNADGPLHRVQTLAYLLLCRYETDSKMAGAKLWVESQTNILCRQTMEELRNELVAPTGDCGFRNIINDPASRKYLLSVLNAFDQSGTDANK